MALNDGEKEALLTQVRTLVSATETKLQRLGLDGVRIILVDGSGVPRAMASLVLDEQALIGMAERPKK